MMKYQILICDAPKISEKFLIWNLSWNHYNQWNYSKNVLRSPGTRQFTLPTEVFLVKLTRLWESSNTSNETWSFSSRTQDGCAARERSQGLLGATVDGGAKTSRWVTCCRSGTRSQSIFIDKLWKIYNRHRFPVSQIVFAALNWCQAICVRRFLMWQIDCSAFVIEWGDVWEEGQL